MIALLLVLIEGVVAPDPAPMLAAVTECDRSGIAVVTRAEPHRRAATAAALYTEQRAIAQAREALRASALPADPGGQAPLWAALDARQKRLDDARTVEAAWRVTIDELRADFLANCSTRK